MYYYACFFGGFCAGYALCALLVIASGRERP